MKGKIKKRKGKELEKEKTYINFKKSFTQFSFPAATVITNKPSIYLSIYLHI